MSVGESGRGGIGSSSLTFFIFSAARVGAVSTTVGGYCSYHHNVIRIPSSEDDAMYVCLYVRTYVCFPFVHPWERRAMTAIAYSNDISGWLQLLHLYSFRVTGSGLG